MITQLDSKEYRQEYADFCITLEW